MRWLTVPDITLHVSICPGATEFWFDQKELIQNSTWLKALVMLIVTSADQFFPGQRIQFNIFLRTWYAGHKFKCCTLLCVKLYVELHENNCTGHTRSALRPVRITHCTSQMILLVGQASRPLPMQKQGSLLVVIHPSELQMRRISWHGLPIGKIF